jgi:hypothetical protein
MNPYGDQFQANKAPIPEGSVFKEATGLQRPAITYTISARSKKPGVPIFAFLRRQYGNIPLQEIESVFGFVDKSTLYGGRHFTGRELSDRDVKQLNNAGIGVRIPMSNHYVDKAEYDASRPLLDEHYSDINSIIITNDDLARWIRRDYPRYTLDASVIKNLKTQRRIDEALELYDSVVLPMKSNEDFRFLKQIRTKEKIILFANAGCALTCPSKLCYASISKMNKFKGAKFRCSQPIKERDLLGMVDFPLEPYVDMGFRHFKLLRSRPNNMTGF